MAVAEKREGGGRLSSLDAYRGFVMLAMASAGLGFAEMSRRRVDSQVWSVLAHQVEHAEWRGCTFWDLIQPSFMFIVGVAMPFSYEARRARGDRFGTQLAHALWRSFLLVVLGVFLSSAWSPRTNFTFVNVLTQIGLGYPFVFLLLGRSPRAQLLAAFAILVGYWAFFAALPVPMLGPDGRPRFFSPHALDGFLGRWNMHANPAAEFDRWFLNLFPRPDGRPFTLNEGGYTTLNFVPSIATMLFGVVAGNWLRGPAAGRDKVRGLIVVGALALVAGMALDQVACPVVKRIWTPSWAVYSAGWTCLLLAFFYGTIDVAGYRRWAFPLVVVGLNSIAFYVMAQLMKPFVRKQLAIHFGAAPFEGEYGPIVRSAAVLATLWLIAYAMYRQRIFVRL